mmetsp:Transcript_25766/g.64982  ORF Transcript_25766/g.64982 Transcript_25766/m.64982 type:complete len:94 (-) Transcript_25766:274-555(-)|eukprot:CAMPEP_0113885384 /NCGR_PEP_ID=MMETSP0780_2-20120614/10880_1 /TAXON_ID=652834 /ORGANISM="Palpitomonas bilix" /LENGTH=93 /DNA_ID=CAMNT_0000873303 /DNA_START=64 /DNA_END=345 /DNA_ORIENTATION=+ /assembly_acc=CAM_ASM_000599
MNDLYGNFPNIDDVCSRASTTVGDELDLSTSHEEDDERCEEESAEEDHDAVSRMMDEVQRGMNRGRRLEAGEQDQFEAGRSARWFARNRAQHE